MANPFGKDFLSNLGRELDRQSVHGSDRGKERPAKQQPKPQRLLRGEPGSPERMAHVIEIGNQIDPSLISELRWEGVGVALQNALHAIRRDEKHEFFDWDEPNYSPETVAQFTTAAKLRTAPPRRTRYSWRGCGSTQRSAAPEARSRPRRPRTRPWRNWSGTPTRAAR